MQNAYYGYVFTAYAAWVLVFGYYAWYWLRKTIRWRTHNPKNTITKMAAK